MWSRALSCATSLILDILTSFNLNHLSPSQGYFFLISYDYIGGAYTDFLPEHNTGIDVHGNELSGNDQPHGLFQRILAPAPCSSKNT